MFGRTATESPPRLSVVGHAGWAQHFWVDRIDPTASKTQSSQHAGLVGSMGANAAIAAARLGAQVQLISRVGDDDLGRAVVSALWEQGVDADAVLPCPGKTTSTSAVVIDASGERWAVSHRGSAIAQNPPALDVGLLAQSDAVLVDPRWSQGALDALHWARSNAVLSVLDADVCPQAVLQALVSTAQWAAFSFNGLKAWLGQELQPDDDSALAQALLAARASGAQNVLVTLGEAGCAWLAGDALCRVPGQRVKVLDSTGAGDVFHAAFAFALASGIKPLKAMRFANAAAALKCQNGAGVLGAPSAAAVQMALSSV